MQSHLKLLHKWQRQLEAILVGVRVIPCAPVGVAGGRHLARRKCELAGGGSGVALTGA